MKCEGSRIVCETVGISHGSKRRQVLETLYEARCRAGHKQWLHDCLDSPLLPISPGSRHFLFSQPVPLTCVYSTVYLYIYPMAGLIQSDFSSTFRLETGVDSRREACWCFLIQPGGKLRSLTVPANLGNGTY